MQNIINIYPKRENTFNRELELLKNWKTSQRNKELISEFQNFLFAQDSRYLRVSKLSSQLRRIVLYLKKNLDEVVQKDIETLIGTINQLQEYSDATKADYRRCVKQFYKWFKKQDERLESENKLILKEVNKFYEYLEEISTGYKRKLIRHDDIITDNDLKNILKNGFNGVDYSQRDKAFISLLHETGARAGEILTMRIKSIQKTDKFAKVTLEGKTGVRNILIVSSLPYLFKWLEVHPFSNNNHSPLWIGLSRRYKNKAITERGAYEIVHRAFIKTNLHKKHNLHWFRHSRATILSQYLTEVQLCKYMGWAIGSNQVRTYCHASDEQTDNSILQLHGMKKQEMQEQPNTPKECSICNELNTGISEYCCKCGTPLSLKTAIKHEEKVKQASDNIMMEFMKKIADNPKVMEEFIKFKKNRD